MEKQLVLQPTAGHEYRCLPQTDSGLGPREPVIAPSVEATDHMEQRCSVFSWRDPSGLRTTGWMLAFLSEPKVPDERCSPDALPAPWRVPSQLPAGRASALEQRTFRRGRSKLQARIALGSREEEPVHT